MRNKEITRDFYVNQLGFLLFGRSDHSGYLMVQKDLTTPGGQTSHVADSHQLFGLDSQGGNDSLTAGTPKPGRRFKLRVGRLRNTKASGNLFLGKAKVFPPCANHGLGFNEPPNDIIGNKGLGLLENADKFMIRNHDIFRDPILFDKGRTLGQSVSKYVHLASSLLDSTTGGHCLLVAIESRRVGNDADRCG